MEGVTRKIREKGSLRGGDSLIFVTVGHHPEGFERLVRKLDEIAPEIGEEIIIQAGSTKYQPRNMQFFSFKSYEEVLKLMKEARVVVCHGGGVVIDVLRLGKPLIIVPRQKKYNEVIDDHQVLLAERLKEEGKAQVIYNMEDLKGLLTQSYPERQRAAGGSELVAYLRRLVNQIVSG